MESEWTKVGDDLPKDSNLKVVKYCRTDTGQHLGIALSHYTKSQLTGVYDFDFNLGTQPTRVTEWASLPTN